MFWFFGRVGFLYNDDKLRALFSARAVGEARFMIYNTLVSKIDPFVLSVSYGGPTVWAVDLPDAGRVRLHGPTHGRSFFEGRNTGSVPT